MTQAFKYNLIRFQPSVETGEFAVIGGVVYSPQSHQLTYQLLQTDQLDRIHDFFRPIDHGILQGVLQRIESELTRIQNLIPKVDNPIVLYEELIRERESIIRFAPAGTIMGERIEDCTSDLFTRYIQRDFSLAA